MMLQLFSWEGAHVGSAAFGPFPSNVTSGRTTNSSDLEASVLGRPSLPFGTPKSAHVAKQPPQQEACAGTPLTATV